MKKIALITELQGPILSPGDQLLVAPLEEYGIQALPVPWDDPAVDWKMYDALILRACWHYPRQHEQFRDWVRELVDKQVQVWNPPKTVFWNLDKRYLRELEVKGIPIVPTVWTDVGATPNLEHILGEQGWEAAVVKPVISTNSDNTWSVTWPPSLADQARVAAMSAGSKLMIQKLMPEITDGEWSLIFIKGKFSHAVLKQPAVGEIFVQEHRGGVTRAAEAPAGLIEAAEQALKNAETLVGQRTLYGRVDGLFIRNQMTLMELELIEPSLYMRHHPPTARRFAKAISRQIP